MLSTLSPLTEDVRILHWGRPLQREATVAESGLADGCTVEVQGRLRGGGGDGGSTGAESRSSYLEMYASKKPDKVNPAEERLALWMNCRLSGDPLTPPCCADRLGSIFNKEAVLEAIIQKKLPAPLSHITAKSLIDLKLHNNPSFQERSKATANQGNFQALDAAPFICPVTGMEANGKARFVVLKRCGTVVAEKAIKQFKESVVELLGYEWEPSEVMPLNPSKEEVEAMRDVLVLERLEAKAKKEKKRKEKSASSNGAHEAVTVATAANKPNGVAPGEEMDGGKNGGKRYKASEHVPTNATSKVYASIFTSSRKGVVKETYMCRSTSARGMNLT